MDWQPIETAPRDGENEILVVAADTSFRQVVYWDLDAEHEAFRWKTTDGPAYHRDAFSHWLPLPDPPPATTS